LLNDYMAQTATNCKLINGDLDNWNVPLTVNTPTKAGTKKSIYLFGGTYWFHWTQDVDVVRGPVAGDTTERTYFTGAGGVPQMTYSPLATTGGTNYPMASYDLGVPAPTAAPTLAVVPTTGSITAATKANPCQLTSTAHGRSTGDLLTISGVGGMTQLNGNTYTITKVDANNFTLNSTDSTGYSTYTSGGTWTLTYDASVIESRAYVYTYVSAIGEEGPPSPVSAIVSVGPGEQVNLSAMLTGPGAGSLNLATKRIYRAVTGGNGTDYLFLVEIALATTTYSDTILDAALGEICPSTYWDPPPTDMAGIVSMPGGILAGFSGNQLCFCEPYTPSAWPTSYRLTTSHPIVALGAFGNSLVVATAGPTYIVTGTTPDSMTMQTLQASGMVAADDPRVLEACVSKRGLVDLGGTILYPVSSGLVAIDAGGARLVSKELIARDYWQALVPSSISAYVYNGKYFGFYDTGTVQGGFLFDPHNPLDPLTFTDQYATAGFFDKPTGKLYLQIGNNIQQWDGGATPLTRTWKSKIFTLESPVNFVYGQLRAFSYPVTFKLYADQVLKLTQTVANDTPFPLPSGFLAREWEFQIEGSAKIKRAALATSIEELLEVA